MVHDSELLAETRAWFARAAQDIRAGDIDLRVVPPLTADTVFHGQQAAEKAMKGFLTWHSQPFRKTHNLTEVGGLCADVDGSLEPLLRRAAVLADYAWKFRYPGDSDEPAREEAEEALATAPEVYDAILARLPEEARP